MVIDHPFSIHGLLTAIFCPFRVTSWSTVPGLFTMSAMQNDVPTWRTIISSSDLPSQCRLKRMIYSKCRRNSQHKFLLLEFYHWSASQTATTILVINRCDQNGENNSDGSPSTCTSGIISPSDSPTLTAVDSVFTTPNINSAIQTYLTKKFGPYAKLCTLDFSMPRVVGPSATQIAVLLSAVGQNTPGPQYHLYQNQCHWFAETVWGAVKQLFSGGVEGPWLNGRSCHPGIKIEKPSSVEVVCQKFNSEWARIENPEEYQRQEKEARVHRLREYEVEITRLRANIAAAELESRSG